MSDTFTSVVVNRSVENFHDDYTPHWLRAGEGQQEYTADYTEFGARVVRAFLEHCYTLINVDEEIRRRKMCLYPEHNAQELKQMFTDLNYEPTAPILRVYSEEMRVKRMFRAEEEANKLPVKMLIPLGLFIFPVILIVILAPIAVRISNMGK